LLRRPPWPPGLFDQIEHRVEHNIDRVAALLSRLGTELLGALRKSAGWSPFRIA
jgi:hypothetical protein